MKIGIYNRHWATMGGGERFGAGIAQALQSEHDVELLSVAPLETAAFEERFELDLGHVGVRVIGSEPGSVSEASESFDLFINVSYLSADYSRAPHSIYVVHFPSPLGGQPVGWRRALAPLSAAIHRGAQAVPDEWGEGFYPTEQHRKAITWTNGRAEMWILPRHERIDLRLRIGRHRPAEAGPASVVVEVDGEPQAGIEVPVRRSRFDRPIELIVPIERRDDEQPSRITITSDTFRPSEILGGDDDRDLGVPLIDMYAGSALTSPLRNIVPVHPGQRARSYVDSYTVIAANAEFTRHFIDRWWGVDAEVLYPPVAMKAAGEKRPIILSVGRFFHAELGHSKKQLEMVRAFRALETRGVTGWELHLVGGCSPADEPYLDEVIEAAEGLPVVIHRDASGSELRELYATASVFWSITGIGEDPRRHPGRFEHFGITTVEAMSAGAVPVVLAAGGQVEIVRDGVDGVHVNGLAELAQKTADLIHAPGRLAALGAAAADRARAFDMPAFSERLRGIVELATAVDDD